nr:biopolymer transporter ExbD [uncultured Cohaesibacter sp.]
MINDYFTKQERKAGPDFSLATINIVFLLLLFFVISGSIVDRSAIIVDPVETQQLDITKLPQPLLILTQDAPMTYNGEPISSENLVQKSSSLRKLYILVSKTYPATEAIKIIDMISQQGTQTILVTYRKNN